MVGPVAAGVPPVEHKETRSEKEYADFLYQTLGPLTLLIGICVCYFVLHVAIDIYDENNLACQLAMTDEEVLAIVPPASRLLDKAKLPPRVRQAVTSSTDSLGLLFAVGAYITRLFSISQKESPHVQTNDAVRQPGNPSSNGFVPEQTGYAGFGAFTVPM